MNGLQHFSLNLVQERQGEARKQVETERLVRQMKDARREDRPVVGGALALSKSAARLVVLGNPGKS